MGSRSKLWIEPSNDIIGLFNSIKKNLKYESLKISHNEKNLLTENQEEVCIASYLYKFWCLRHLIWLSELEGRQSPRWKPQNQDCSLLAPKLPKCSLEAAKGQNPHQEGKFSQPLSTLLQGHHSLSSVTSVNTPEDSSSFIYKRRLLKDGWGPHSPKNWTKGTKWWLDDWLVWFFFSSLSFFFSF